MLSIKDALDALEGRWKLLILFSLTEGPKRFRQLSKEVTGITDKVLSKELKNLEANRLIERSVYDTFSADGGVFHHCSRTFTGEGIG